MRGLFSPLFSRRVFLMKLAATVAAYHEGFRGARFVLTLYGHHYQGGSAYLACSDPSVSRVMREKGLKRGRDDSTFFQSICSAAQPGSAQLRCCCCFHMKSSPKIIPKVTVQTPITLEWKNTSKQFTRYQVYNKTLHIVSE